MKNETLVERRRVVYSALARHFKKDQLLEALWLWEQKYSMTNGLEIRKFVSEIVPEDDPTKLKSTIYKSLTRATYFPGDIELLPDPINEMQTYKQKCNGKFRYISPFDSNLTKPFATIVFQHIVDSILQNIKRHNTISHAYIIRSMLTALAMFKLEDVKSNEIKSWLQSSSTTLQLHYAENFMSKFINELYKNCCEQLGPVITDQLFAKSVQDASEIEEAKFFNPKRLL